MININPGLDGEILKTKLNYIFCSKNKGLKTLRKINKALLSEEV